jgi:hypothetical protein
MANWWGGLLALDAPAQDAKPLTPVEAIKKVNEEVHVQMLVKAAKNRLEKRGEIYLDSEENFRDENNLGIVITKTGAAKFREAGVNDPAVHFQDKIIRVKGTVIIKEQRPRIEVDDPKDIRIVVQESTKAFTYTKTKQADLEIVVHYPPGWKETHKRPGIVFFFGGGWENGTIKAFEPQAKYLATRKNHAAGTSDSSEDATATASGVSAFCFFFLGNLGAFGSWASGDFSLISTPWSRPYSRRPCSVIR